MQPAELAKRIKSKKPPTVVDVRTVFEFRKGHIPAQSMLQPGKYLLRLAKIPSDKDAELVVTCELGPRAQIAKGLLEGLRLSQCCASRRTDGRLAASGTSSGEVTRS